MISLVFLLFLLGVNTFHVNSYGELGKGSAILLNKGETYASSLAEYILSSLKVVTIVTFIIVGACVDLGLNRERRVIGFSNWEIPGAPFVNGLRGFARVFVTASFACTSTENQSVRFVINPAFFLDGGTESLGITAGETRNPTKNMPRVVKFVFWR